MKYTGYMCRIDFECERGYPTNGNRFFEDIEDLRKAHDCSDDCGIVEVEISLKRIVVEGTD